MNDLKKDLQIYYGYQLDETVETELIYDARGKVIGHKLLAGASIIAAMFTLVGQQANDDGLWFRAETAAEGYLQQELRRLHTVIEELEKRG